MKQTILDSYSENGTLSMINQIQNLMQEIKLSLTQVLKSNLCDYIDAYILAKGVIITTANKNPTPQHSTIVHHILNVSQKLMEQEQMMLRTQTWSC